MQRKALWPVSYPCQSIRVRLEERQPDLRSRISSECPRTKPSFVPRSGSGYPLYLESGEIIPLSFHVLQGQDAEKVNQELDKYRDGKAVDNIYVHP
jgi:hypothetical protein